MARHYKGCDKVVPAHHLGNPMKPPMSQGEADAIPRMIQRLSTGGVDIEVVLGGHLTAWIMGSQGSAGTEGYEALTVVIATLEEKGHEAPEPGSFGI